MKRSLNNIERANLKYLKELGYTPVVQETFQHAGKTDYYAEVVELKAWIALDAEDLTRIPKKCNHLKPIYNANTYN